MLRGRVSDAVRMTVEVSSWIRSLMAAVVPNATLKLPTCPFRKLKENAPSALVRLPVESAIPPRALIVPMTFCEASAWRLPKTLALAVALP